MHGACWMHLHNAPHGAPRLPGILGSLGWSLTGSKQCNISAWLIRVCCIGLQLTPHVTLKLPGCLGSLSGALWKLKQYTKDLQLLGVTGQGTTMFWAVHQSCTARWSMLCRLSACTMGLTEAPQLFEMTWCGPSQDLSPWLLDIAGQSLTRYLVVHQCCTDRWSMLCSPSVCSTLWPVLSLV